MCKAVITDVDGTLCDSIGIAWMRYLGANQLIDEAVFNQHENLVDAYECGLIDHPNFAQEWIAIYGVAIKGKTESELMKYARRFFSAFAKTIPDYSFQLVRHFKSRGYRVFAVTVSPAIPARLVLEHIGINDFAATEPEVENGAYTGRMLTELHTPGHGKANAVLDIISKNGIDTSRSFALGDTIHDIPMLESVAYPIALNPKQDLARYAAENGFWIADGNNILDVIEKIEKGTEKSTFEQMKFVYEAGMLKYTPRSGWAHIQVDSPESVAEHVFRASVIAYLLAVEEGEDPCKCASALVMHELGECRIGDVNKITARYWENKSDSEKVAAADMAKRLDDKKKKKVLEALDCFGKKKIADICRDADLLENLATAREYEFKGYVHAREWIKRIQPILVTATGRKWGRALAKMDPNLWWFGIKSQKIR
ncbi:MAG: HAD-IB family phosphatase [Candidatus Micrarchaeota archaeon]|nr:HAD-IB family phosphatase [Candidatus Micrarchaeota archaeon]